MTNLFVEMFILDLSHLLGGGFEAPHESYSSIRKDMLWYGLKHLNDHGLSLHFPVKWMWKLHDGWINVSIAMVITRSSLVQLLILLDWLAIYLSPNNSFSFERKKERKRSNILRCGLCCSHIQLQIDLLNWLQNVEVFTNCGL